jgi:hypothetical protein
MESAATKQFLFFKFLFIQNIYNFIDHEKFFSVLLSSFDYMNWFRYFHWLAIKHKDFKQRLLFSVCKKLYEISVNVVAENFIGVD